MAGAAGVLALLAVAESSLPARVGPLLVAGLVWTGRAIVATVPLLLGWLVLLPVTHGAWYASYRDIFRQGAADPA